MVRIGGLCVLVLSVSACLLVGCGPRGRVDTTGVTGPGGPLPGTARIYGEGAGELHFRAPADGVFYLYDVDRKRVLLTEFMERDMRITVNPQRQTVTLGGYPPRERTMAPTHTHRMYFDRMPK